MIVTTGNSVAVAANSLAICRKITALISIRVDALQGQNKKTGTEFKLNFKYVPVFRHALDSICFQKCISHMIWVVEIAVSGSTGI